MDCFVLARVLVTLNKQRITTLVITQAVRHSILYIILKDLRLNDSGADSISIYRLTIITIGLSL